MRKLRAAATAILLGTAALGAGAAFQAAQAATVSAAVGRPLTDARSLADAKKYKEAMDRVNAAGAAAKTPAEHQMVDQMKQYIAVKSGDASIGGALGAKAKFANDVNAGKWKDVIADGDLLRKNNALDAQSQLVIAQAYYQLHDPKGCIGYIKRAGLGGETALTLLQRCAYDANDDVTQRQALEQLVASTGKAEHWKSLLHLSERARGMKDHNTLDVYRLKAMTGNLEAQDIELYTTFAIQFKSPAEAKAVLEKAIADKTIQASDRTNRLLKLANDRLNAANAGAAKALADAQKAPKGDDLVQIGEAQVGAGNAKEAIATIQAGIAKGVSDPADAQLRLGTAYLGAGQKAEALKAFNAVKGDEKTVMIAHLYSLAARSNAPAAAAPAKGRKR
jgi:hypothetical protein